MTLVGIYMIASLSKSINKFYQTMEKQLSPYTNKSLRDFSAAGSGDPKTRRRNHLVQQPDAGKGVWRQRLLWAQPGRIFSGGQFADRMSGAGVWSRVQRTPVHRLPRTHRRGGQPPECTVSGGRRQAQAHRTGVLFLPTGGSHHPHRQLRGAAAKRA